MDAMRAGRAKHETNRQEAVRLHREMLPELRAREQQYAVSEAKKAKVLEQLRRLEQEEKVVRRKGAVGMLTKPQMQLQLALRHFLHKLAVKRTGSRKVLTEALEVAVAAEVEAREKEKGPDEVTTDGEKERLKGLGLGPKRRTGGKRAAGEGRGRQPRRQRQRHASGESSSESAEHEPSDDESDSSSISKSEEEEEDTSGSSESEETMVDGIDIEALLQKDDEVYEVERLVSVREENDARLYEVKWKGWSSKHNTMEPAAHILGSLVDRFERKEAQQQ